MNSPKTHIDWKNHLIAFLSALLGILIAFQLEDYRSRQNDLDNLDIAMSSIKNEIENNLAIYKSNTELLNDWLDYYSLSELVNQNNEVTVSKPRYQELSNNPNQKDRYENWVVVVETNDSVTLNVPENGPLIDFLPATDISTSSWYAAINSGLLTRVDNNVLNKLTSIYQWTEKDFGLDELDLFQLPINSEVSNTEEDSIDELVEYFKKLHAIHSWKHRMILPIFEDLEWQ